VTEHIKLNDIRITCASTKQRRSDTAG